MHSCNYSTTNTAFYMNYFSEKDLHGKKAREYYRKSNESDEKQAYSLEDQLAIGIKLIERHKLITVGIPFSESRTAKRRGRPQYNELLADIESEKYSVIICWELNRLSRNAVDSAMLIELMDNRKLFAIVTSGKVYFNTPDDKLLMQIELGLAKKYSDDIWPSVERGMNSKVHRHWWPGKPKQGYLNIRDAVRDEPVQIKDPERFPLLRNAVERILSGITPAESLKILNDQDKYTTRKTKKIGGLPLAESNFYKLLKDPFYYGKLIWNGQESELHESVPRLMSDTEYWAIQTILGSKGVQRPKTALQVPYRGMLKCACCKQSIVVYPKYKTLSDGTKKTYLYAKRSKKGVTKNCIQPNIPLEGVEKQIKEILASVRISKRFYDWALEWIKADHEELSETRQNDLANNHALIEAKNKALDKLLELRINDEIDKEVYLQKKSQYEKEINDLNLMERNIHTQAKDWRSLAERALNVARFAYENFDTASPDSKLEMMRDLGSNFLLNDTKLSLDIEKPFLIFQNSQEYLNNEYEGIELTENIIVTNKDGSLQPITDIWWARRESNPHPPKRTTF